MRPTAHHMPGDEPTRFILSRVTGINDSHQMGQTGLLPHTGQQCGCGLRTSKTGIRVRKYRPKALYASQHIHRAHTNKLVLGAGSGGPQEASRRGLSGH